MGLNVTNKIIKIIFNCLDILNDRNMAIQIDIKKAFDTMKWTFIIHILKAFGFSEKLCCWIKTILLLAKISVLLNGVPTGFFGCSHGVRQGDPLSPLIFDIAEDFLSRYLSAFM